MKSFEERTKGVGVPMSVLADPKNAGKTVEEIRGEAPKLNFKEWCQEKATSQQARNRLWDIFIGYKGVKASESLKAFEYMVTYGVGKAPEHVVVEDKGGLRSLSPEELRAIALKRVLEMGDSVIAVEGGSKILTIHDVKENENGVAEGQTEKQ
jgi:hypothetical protein